MAPATMYVTPAGAGTKAGNNWANAMGLAEFETDVEGAAEAGDIYYVAGGTYTFTGSIQTSLDGTATNPIMTIGVAAGTTNEPPVFADWASGDGRPLFACGLYYLSLDDYWIIANIRGTSSSGVYTFHTDIIGTFINCKAGNTGGGTCMLCSNGGLFIDCEMYGASSGTGCDVNNGCMYGCYLHDLALGVTQTSYAAILCSIFSDCTVGVDIAAAYVTVANCTINGGTTGIDCNAQYGLHVFNNIISNNTTGLSFDSVQGGNYIDYNDWYGNTSDVSNATKGNNALAVDPQFTNAAGGDFSIGTNLKAAGFPGAFPGGLSTGYLDVGAVQRQEAAGAAGGLLVHPGMAGGMRG